ncbi:MAG: hypothetical protein J0L53_13375 [Spirochaetes bacterium]|nr:hypothetical protein [Spirochaetota bacterium]
MKLRFRFYLKLFVAIFAVLVTAGILWFIFRVEAYILSRLPPEIKIDALSVSFLNQSFILSGAKISGKPGTICEGKVVLEIGEAEGKFKLRQRKLTELILKKPAVKGEALKRGCFTKPGEKPEIRLGEGIGPEGLKITLHDGKIPLPELGEFDFNAVLAARENEHGALVVAFERFAAGNGRLVAETKKLALAFVRGGEAIRLSDGEIMGTVKAARLEKLPRLNTKKLRVVNGTGEIRFSADIRRGTWTIYTDVDLKNLKLRGEPLYNMPMGLMQLTPENAWPMVEDSPGFFNFSFKTASDESRLAKTYAADFRNALTRKVKANLKKKIPVLPF